MILRRLILKSVYPTIQEAKDAVIYNEFYAEDERGWMFFDNRIEMEDWIEMCDEKVPF